MKKIIFLLIILLSTQIVLADTVKKGESTYANGRTVTLIGVSQDSVIVSVDGVKDIISLNDEKEINGLEIRVTSIFHFDEDIGSAELEITSIGDPVETGPVCGDGECEGEEDKENCCEDCGCKYGFGCENGNCVKAECMEHKECYADPKDYCSLDKCDSIQKKCTHTPITDCVVKDKCCPIACYYPDDPDCPETKLDPNPKKKKESKAKVEESTGDTESQEKISFFKKIINWILGLFS